MSELLSQDSSTSEVTFNKYTPRVAIVTGSAQGIGYSIALRLAEDGIDVAINDIPIKHDQINTVVEEIRKKGRRAIAVPADMSSESDIIAMVDKTVGELGNVDIMVANAGFGAVYPFLETDTKIFDLIYEVHIRGVFFCYKYAALQMIKQGNGGRLIAASSSAGKQGIKNLGAYSAAKFAVRGMTQTASMEFRQHGITVNAYAPGFIDTPMTSSGDDRCASLLKTLDLPPETPVSGPETVASIVSYLVRPEAYFINGQTISVDGGFRYS